MLKYIKSLIMLILLSVFVSGVFAQETIEIGDTIEGEESDEVTEYEIDLEEDQTIVIEIDADWDTYLELYDDNGNQVASDDDGGDGTLSRLVYTVEDTDTHIIRVRAFGSDTPSGDYELTVSLEEIENDDQDDDDQQQDDDQDDEITTIEIGESIDGEESDEITEYEIDLEDGQTIVIEIDANWDTYLELYDDNDNYLVGDDDGGDGTQSRIIYQVEDTDTYVIRVRAYSGDTPEGDYELSVDLLDVIDVVNGGLLEYGNDEDVDADDALAVEFTFEGEEGDLINIIVTSENYYGFELTLLDPQDDDIEFTDSYGEGSLRFIELEDDGTYTILIEAYEGTVFDGEIEAEVELTEKQSLDDGSLEIEVGDNTNQEFVFFTGEDDVIYELTISLDDEPDYSEISFYILEEGQDPSDYSDYSIRMVGGTGMSYIFEADDDGEFTIRIEYYGSDDIEVTLDIEAIEE